MTWWQLCNLINAPHRFFPSPVSSHRHLFTFPTTSPFVPVASVTHVWAAQEYLWWALSGDWARRQSGENKQKRWGRCSREESISLPIVPIFCQTREGRRDLLKQRRKSPIGWANPGPGHQKSNSSSSQFVQIVRSELSHPDLCLPGLFFTSFLPSLVIGFIL